MSDGPLPESTSSVDSSLEQLTALIAECRAFDPTGQYGSVRLQTKILDALAQVARERDEAITKLETFKQNLRLRGDLDPAAAAERQLAEARAALAELVEQASKLGEVFGLEEDGHIVGTQTRPRYSAALRKARALLSGETT